MILYILVVGDLSEDPFAFRNKQDALKFANDWSVDQGFKDYEDMVDNDGMKRMLYWHEVQLDEDVQPKLTQQLIDEAPFK
jgi:hypothetical protein